jgi:uncharacterized DUF497 family protein
MRIVQSVQFTEFEWDENKALSNYEKHGITFDEAAESLTLPHLEQESNRHGEIRILAICPLSHRIIAIVYTVRGEKCRIISARTARTNEQRTYRLVYA